MMMMKQFSSFCPLREKCDALALELAEQESLRRTAVSEVESRAHTAWLEARAAKREADAARDEAATLRRKLASVAADGASSPHHSKFIFTHALAPNE
jgi:hypothetical protein